MFFFFVTVDSEGLAGDPVMHGQEQGCLGDIGGAAEAAERDPSKADEDRLFLSQLEAANVLVGHGLFIAADLRAAEAFHALSLADGTANLYMLAHTRAWMTYGAMLLTRMLN